MKYQAENAVSSFFYYMWNAWCEEECRTVFKEMHPHFWEKWSLMTDKGIFGAAERFYAELTDRYREKLVERALPSACMTAKPDANTRTIPKSRCAMIAVQRRLKSRHGWM